MNNDKIGVIVPVYKTEKFIAECIESILAQTYTNFRLILVDDGTPDNAGKICDEYAKKDNRITVIHQENAGVTRARARGVEEANDCEWITFVDSDDMLANTALYDFIEAASNNIDIVLNSTYYTETTSCTGISPFYKFNGPLLSIEDFRKNMISTKGGMPWGRMFRKAIIKPSAFEIPREIYYGEDAITNTRIAFNTEKPVAVIEKPLYFYRQMNDGVCKNFAFTHNYEDLLSKYILKSIPVKEQNHYCNEIIWRRLWIWTSLFNQSITKPSWSNTSFHKRLISDIKKYNCKISIFDWLLLKYTNSTCRILIILIRKSYLFLRRFI